MGEAIKSKPVRYKGDPYTYRELVGIAFGKAVGEGFQRSEEVVITNE